MKPETKVGIEVGLIAAAAAINGSVAGIYFTNGKWAIGLVWAFAATMWCVSVGISANTAYLKGHNARSRELWERSYGS